MAVGAIRNAMTYFNLETPLPGMGSHVPRCVGKDVKGACGPTCTVTSIILHTHCQQREMEKELELLKRSQQLNKCFAPDLYIRLLIHNICPPLQQIFVVGCSYESTLAHIRVELVNRRFARLGALVLGKCPRERLVTAISEYFLDVFHSLLIREFEVVALWVPVRMGSRFTRLGT